MPPKKSNTPTNESFESGLEQLEKLVETLESQDLNLDEAIKAFEEGIKLSRTLSEKLTEAEAKLEILTKGVDGLPSSAPLKLDKDEDQWEEDNDFDEEEDDDEDENFEDDDDD
jgi:exodeoxyribonuclease VII small subunit